MRSSAFCLTIVILLCLTSYTSYCQSKADTVVWNGSQNGDWNNSNNWVAGKKPSRLSTVHIPSGAIHQPIFSLDTLVVANLKTDSGTVINIASGVLQVAGATMLSGKVNVLQGAGLGTAGNQLVYYDQNDTTAIRRMVGSFEYRERGITIDYFGTKNSTGQISSISAACLYKNNNKDTVYNFTFNSEALVRTFYVSISGVKDSSIYKFYHQDSVVIINRFKINWSNNDVTLRETYILDRVTLASVQTIVYRTTNMATNNCSPSQSKLMMRLRNDAIIAALGGLLIRAPHPLVALAGVGLLLYGVNDINQLNLGLLNSLTAVLASFFNDACAGERPLPPSVLPDPKNETGNITSPVYRRCYFTHTFRTQMSCCKPLMSSIPHFVSSTTHQGPYTTCEGITYPPGTGFPNTWTFWMEEGRTGYISYSAGSNCEEKMFNFRCDAGDN